MVGRNRCRRNRSEDGEEGRPIVAGDALAIGKDDVVPHRVRDTCAWEQEITVVAWRVRDGSGVLDNAILCRLGRTQRGEAGICLEVVRVVCVRVPEVIAVFYVPTDANLVAHG